MYFDGRKRRVFDIKYAQQNYKDQQDNNHHHDYQYNEHHNDVRNVSATSFLSNDIKQHKKPRISRLRQMATVSGIKNWFLENLRNYCNSTSLHGFSYITVKHGTTTAERLFWIGVVILAIIISIILVVLSWFSNRETPTITVIESSHYPTWNVPFPAVTICNFNKVSKLKATQLIKSLKRPKNVTDEQLFALFRATMYFSISYNNQTIDYKLFEQILTDNNTTLAELTERTRPDCMEMVLKCIWKGTITRCETLFQRIISLEGVCCSFNYFGQSTNNFPLKISYQIPKRPYRVAGCGYPTGLSIVLNPFSNDYFGTSFSSFGFRVLIHDAYNFAAENAETMVVTSNRESFVRISPESTYATPDVKTMDIKLRNCLFSNDKKLITMQRYSFINCMFECRRQLLFERCGCVPMDLTETSIYPVCELKEVDCVVKNKEIFTHAQPTINDTFSPVKSSKTLPCDCLPNCEVNRYPSEITTGRLYINLTLRQNSAAIAKGLVPSDNILLHVFFSDLLSTRYRTDIFENWLSALASFGGLLGLIMGFSIVTAFEFFYFLTFRPIFGYFYETTSE